MINPEENKNMEEKKMMKINGIDLLEFAKQPKGNPETLDKFSKYEIPLIAEDYPAKTAIMWNAVYKQLGMDIGNIMGVGKPEDCAKILDALREDPKYIGGGAGVGFKDVAFGLVDELDPIAEAIGSINFILKTPEGKLKGFNTDGAGFAMSLKEIFNADSKEMEGSKAVILGAGGTSNSVAFSLAENRMEVVILNRTVEKAKSLAERINHFLGEDVCRFGGENEIEKEVVDADAIVNVSTKGAAGDFENYSALAPAALPATKENITKNLEESKRILSELKSGTIVCDVVLRNEATPMLAQAKDSGLETLNGIPMVVNQAVEAFWLLHGKEMEEKEITKSEVADIMKKAAYA
jgi:shikimate dehydrogenase